MSMSKANSARLSCALVVSIIILLLLIVIATIVAVSYWVYLHFGLNWAIATGVIIVLALLFLNYRSRIQRTLNADVKVYVEVNPEHRKRLKEFIKALRKQQKYEKVDDEKKDIWHKLNNLIESETQLRFHFLGNDKYYYYPEMLMELQDYIKIAERDGDSICVEELQRLTSLIEQCKQQGVSDAFTSLGNIVVGNFDIAKMVSTGAQSILCIEYSRNFKRDPKPDDNISSANLRSFQCNKCKHYFADYVWLLIDIFERPDLFAQLPQIHTFECPHCGYKIQLQDHAVLVNFYSDRIPPITIFTNDQMQGNPHILEEIGLLMDKKLPSIAKTFAGDNPFARQHTLRIQYGPVHPIIGAIDLIHEAIEPMTEFAKTYPKEFGDWLANVLLLEKDLDSAVLFYSGTKQDLSTFYRNYGMGDRKEGREIIDMALHRALEYHQSIAFKIMSIVVPIAGILIGMLFGQITSRSSLWAWTKNGLSLGALLGIVLIFLSIWITPLVILIEAKIRKITLPIFKPGLEALIFSIFISILGPIIGLIFNLFAMSIFLFLSKWVSAKPFASATGAFLGLMSGLLLRPKSVLEIVFYARHAKEIFLRQ